MALRALGRVTVSVCAAAVKETRYKPLCRLAHPLDDTVEHIFSAVLECF